MKYQYFSLLLILLLIFPGCSQSVSNTASTITFYYVHNELEFGSENGVMKATVREYAGHEDDYFDIISQYLNGPTSYDCISPFPAGTMLEELNWDQNRVQVVLTPHITTLSGSDLIIACACLTRTIAEITGINTVQIRSSSGLLNGEEILTLTAESFLYCDDTESSIIAD